MFHQHVDDARSFQDLEICKFKLEFQCSSQGAMGFNIRKGWGSMGFQRWIDHSSAFCWSLHPNSSIAPVWHSMAIMASQSAWTNLRRRHPLFSSESQHCTLQAQAEKIWGAQGNGGGKGSYPTSRCLTNQNGKGIWEKDRTHQQKSGLKRKYCHLAKPKKGLSSHPWLWVRCNVSFIPSPRGCRPEVYHVTNSLGFV